jgi:hypothetical protein
MYTISVEVPGVEGLVDLKCKGGSEPDMAKFAVMTAHGGDFDMGWLTYDDVKNSAEIDSQMSGEGYFIYMYDEDEVIRDAWDEENNQAPQFIGKTLDEL